MKAITLLYHDTVPAGEFSASGFLVPGANKYKLDVDDFAAHLAAISKAVAAPPETVLDDASRDDSRRRLFLTFDDGGVSASEHIARLLEQYGWRGHFLMTTNWIGAPRFLNPEQIRDLRRRGHVIGSHSCSHPIRMALCTWPQLLEEWRESTRVLSDILGEPVTVASVPGGHYSRQVAEAAAQAGIRTLFNSEPTIEAEQVDGCTVLGRFNIMRGMSPQAAAAIASGRVLPRMRQAAFWKMKKFAKSTAGTAYLGIRNVLLRGK